MIFTGHFSIRTQWNGQVIDVISPSKIVVTKFNSGRDNQYWSWDGNTLRNKAYPDKVNYNLKIDSQCQTSPV